MNMKLSMILGLTLLALTQTATAIEMNVDTAKKAAELAGVKVPDALGGNTSTSMTSVAASALGGGDALGAVGTLTGNSPSGTAAGVLMGVTSPTDAAAIALGVKKEPTAEEKAMDALKAMMK
jgi:hypothetical protein